MMLKEEKLPPSDEELVAELRWLVHRVMQAAEGAWVKSLQKSDNPDLAMTRCARALGTIARTVERLSGLEKLPVQDPRTSAFLIMRKRLNAMLAGFSFAKVDAPMGGEGAKTFSENVADTARAGSLSLENGANVEDVSAV
ncbi:MAG: hypothetical protein MRY72_00260 [Aquisalinus sp.]|nr:hypothetical protein [Aquisalinus sp.]